MPAVPLAREHSTRPSMPADDFFMKTTLLRSNSEAVAGPLAERRALARLLAPLDQLAEQSPCFVARSLGQFESAGRSCALPRYIYLGLKGGGDIIRVGIFAAIHGDEPEGARALTRFAGALEKNPEIGRGYALFLYPVCNPTGFEDNTRHSRSGKDLNREFWNNSTDPAVRLLQSELVVHSFHGIISLHTDDTCDGFYGFVHGATLTKHLIEPALRAVETFLPRDGRPVIDGFQARNGVIRDSYAGMLSAPPNVRPRPFEITLEMPKAPPSFLKESAFALALKTILTEYRKFIAYAPNL